MITWITHNRVRLALHRLRDGRPGRPLLILHGLGEETPSQPPAWVERWPGAVYGLDFTGHGRSSLPRGGGYTSEILLADADAALAALDDAINTDDDGNTGDDGDAVTGITVLGRGLGGYIALQLAGARAARIHGAIICDGPGLAGGPSEPTSQSFVRPPHTDTTPDPYALIELGRDLRPPDYATAFVRLAVAESPLEIPIAVTAAFQPPWLAAVVAEQGVIQCSIDEALERYAR